MELDAVKVSATIIVISKDRKALIVQRPPDKTFPNLWTVAGGKMQDNDGVLAGNNFLYFSAEFAAVRELREETGITVPFSRIKYLCSLYAGQIKRLVLSYYIVIDKNADEIEIKLDECQTYRWITKNQIKEFDFIPDIGGEIEEVFHRIDKFSPDEDAEKCAYAPS
jgi:8-oxo-dGTP pyrophosphatase MutT (NUDIX family)